MYAKNSDFEILIVQNLKARQKQNCQALLRVHLSSLNSHLVSVNLVCFQNSLCLIYSNSAQLLRSKNKENSTEVSQETGRRVFLWIMHIGSNLKPFVVEENCAT